MGDGLRVIGTMLGSWDVVAASRPDYYLAISHHVADRIKKYYNRNVEKVIYPPVDTQKFRTQNSEPRTQNFFLCISRLVPYKRVDQVITAFNSLGWKLKIIGKGSEEHYLRGIAKKNIEFLGGDLTDSELAAYYQNTRAFVFAGDEDFGIASLEAQACGTPVICPEYSGMAETVIEGKTGELFTDDLTGVLHKFVKQRYDSGSCRLNAQRFSTERFQSEMKREIERLTTI
jgi:glycosyltransferase involved in cell wall biosynthesis